MDDGVVKTSIYCVVCPVVIRGHTACMVKTRHRTLLLGVYDSLRLPVYMYFYLAICKHCPDFFYEFIMDMIVYNERSGPV